MSWKALELLIFLYYYCTVSAPYLQGSTTCGSMSTEPKPFLSWIHAAFGSTLANMQRQQLTQLGIHRATYALCLLPLWHLDR